MILNQKKTKVMIFNFTDNYKFTAKLELNGEMLDVVKEAKLLGVIITDDLKWDRNTDYIVKKANMRMELLRKWPISPHPLRTKKKSMSSMSEVSWSNRV